MNIFPFIKNLTPDEIAIISKAFTNKDHRLKKSKESKFFKLCLDTPSDELCDGFIFKRLGTWDSENAYVKFKSRILTKIFNEMCTEDYIANPNIFDDVDRAEIRIKKKLLQAKILSLKASKSDPEVFNNLVNEIIDEAKQYEVYDWLVEALSYKKYRSGNRLGYKEFVKYQEEIKFFKQCADAKTQATDMYYEYITNQKLISQISEEDLVKFVAEKVRILESSPFTTISTKIQYFYHIFRLAKFQNEKRNNESIDTCLELLSLLQRSKAIGRRERFGHVYVNLAKCFILQRSFKQAAQTSRKAQMFFPQHSLSFILAKEQEFFAVFYSRDFKRADEILEMMLSYNLKDSGKIRVDMFTYYKGWLHFAQGDFKEAKRVANLSLEIMKDKPRWDLGVRYLKIMSHIELREIDEAVNAIEALRKQIKRTSETQEVAGRDELIYKALKEFALCKFENDNKSLNYYLKKLGQKDSVNSWRTHTHEIVPLHKWMKGKLAALEIRPGKSNRPAKPSPLNVKNYLT